jgi:hypothetical protein
MVVFFFILHITNPLTLGSTNTHTHTDVMDTEKEKTYTKERNSSLDLFRHAVSCEVLNDQNEQMLDHKLYTQMV